MSRIVRWETPFTDAFYPGGALMTTPYDADLKKGVGSIVLVSPGGIGQYPQYLVDFGEVLACTSMEEACCPDNDFSSATLDEAITGENFICAFQWFESPWLKSYEPCHDPEGLGLFSHYLLFGGDNNVQVITKNTPEIRTIRESERVTFEWAIN